MSTHNAQRERPPVVAVVGHIDHGKSSLLDSIRSANTIETEAGGITQHLASYEVTHTTADGVEKKITFIDTPGHEAFMHQRSHCTRIADIAVLVVSAEDGPKAQTLEAIKAIKDCKTPYVVAISKIDTEKANPEKTITGLTEAEVYLEGRGGDVPYALVSAKTGAGMDDLLETILLVAEIEELRGDPEAHGAGVVIEAHLDEQRGITATLLMTDGTLTTGTHLAAGKALCPVRRIEDTLGTPRERVTFSTPIVISGWSELPRVGAPFASFTKKKEAEKYAAEHISEKSTPKQSEKDVEDKRVVIPLIIKADVVGTIEAIEHELRAIPQEKAALHIIQTGVGTITEGDIKNTGLAEGALVLGFNVKVETAAAELAERIGASIKTFSIIYKLKSWVEEIVTTRTPVDTTSEKHGEMKVLKIFSQTKKTQVLGGSVTEGELRLKDRIHITRRETEIGTGKVLELQVQKSATQTVSEGNQCGAKIESTVEIAEGDTLEAYSR